MLFLFPIIVMGMFTSAAFMEKEDSKDSVQSRESRVYLVCDTVGDNCHWIKKETICDHKE
jgi:hypothetical protein